MIFELDLEANPHPRLLALCQFAAEHRADTVQCEAFYQGVVLACSAATGEEVGTIEAWIRSHS